MSADTTPPSSTRKSFVFHSCSLNYLLLSSCISLFRILFKPVRALLGGRVRFMLTGGAPLAAETHRYLRAALCCPLLQGYGLTETCSGTTIMDVDDKSTGLTGAPLTCCDIKLVNWEEGNYRVKDRPYPRGEIHVGGANVVVGYYKQPGKTKEDFYEEDGKRWFRTGDIGQFHTEGVLQVGITRIETPYRTIAYSNAVALCIY